FFPDTSPPALYTLSLHDALPILYSRSILAKARRVTFFDGDITMNERYRIASALPSEALGNTASVAQRNRVLRNTYWLLALSMLRSEEHTSELQSRENLVCRLLLE